MSAHPVSSRLHLALLVLCGVVSIFGFFPVSASTTAGALDADFKVTKDGAALYVVPIAVPPGTAGAGPDLSLIYSSSGGDGLAGMGFELAGLSAIERCPATIAQDGVPGGVEYDAGDRFCLDGQRLINIDSADPYFEDGAIYHTEKESWRKVVAHGGPACGGGPCSFTVYRKDGSVWTYGTDGGSQVVAVGALFAGGQAKEGAVRVWALREIEDRNGNVLTVTYTATPVDVDGDPVSGVSTGDGQAYPSRIDYTSNSTPDPLCDNEALVAQRSVQFFYAERPDVTTHYQGGAGVKTAARLAAVRTCVDAGGIAGKACVGDSLVSEYQLEYADPTTSTTGRSRVLRMTRCGGDDGGGDGDDSLCLPPTVFDWQAGESGLVAVGGGTTTELDTTHAFCPSNGFVTWADFDGDGLVDWICNTPNGEDQGRVQVLRSNGAQLVSVNQSSDGDLGTTLAQCSAENGVIRWADFDGDGKVDWICNNPTGLNGGGNVGAVWILRSTGTGLEPLSGSGTGGQLPSALADCSGATADQVVVTWADFDGDSRLDWICNDPGGSGGVWVLLSDGTDLEGIGGELANGQLALPDQAATCGGGAADTLWDDFNGDGLADWICADPGEGTVQVWLSTGATLEASPAAFPGDGKLKNVDALCSGTVEWLDFNGDRLLDWVCQEDGDVRVQLSDGTSLVDLGTLTGTYTCDAPADPRWLDFNGDGLADWTCNDVDTGAVEVFLSTGAALVAADGAGGTGDLGTTLAACSQSGSAAVWSDFDGDGLADWICNQRDSGTGGDEGFVWVALHQPPFPDLATRITDGFGGEIQLTYAPLTDTAVYTPQTPDYPAGDVVAFPNLTFDRPLYVVAGVEKRNAGYSGSACPITDRSQVDPGDYCYAYGHHYAGGVMNLQGRGFLGFAAFTFDDPQIGSRLTTAYHQDFPFAGSPSQRSLCDPTAVAGDDCDPSPTLLTTDYAYYCENGCTGDPLFEPYPGVYQVLLTTKTETDASFGSRLRKQYDYDDYGNLVQLTDLGDVADTSHPLTTCSGFDNDETTWRLGFQTDQKKSSAADCPAPDDWDSYEFVDDVDLSWQRWTPDAAGNVESATSWDDSGAGIWLGHQYGLDVQGNQVSAQTLSGDSPAAVAGTTSQTGYECTFRTFPASSTTARADAADPGSALTTQAVWDARFGTQVARIDPNGQVRALCLDRLGRPAKTQGPQDGTGAQADVNCLAAAATTAVVGDANAVSSACDAALVTLSTTTWTAAAGSSSQELVRRVEWGTGTWEDAVTGAATSNVDGLGRAWRRLSPGDGGDVLVDTVYASQRLVAQTSLPYPDGTAAGDVLWVTTHYDLYGRRQSRERPTAAGTVTTTWQPSVPNTVTETDAAGTADARAKVTRSEYYNSKRRTATMSLAGATTHYDYDLLGRPWRITDPAGVVNTLVYDSLGRKSTFSETGLGTTSFTYDAVGNLHQTTDAKKQTVTYVWDGVGRPSSETSAAGSVVYTYDTSADPATYQNVAGELSTATVKDARGTLVTRATYGYDAYGNRARRTVGLSGVDYAFARTYDPQGRPVGLVLPDAAASEIVRSYTPAGQLSRLRLAGETYVIYDGFNAFGQPTEIDFDQSGVVERLTYFDSGELATHVLLDGGSAQQLADVYSWDVFGNVSGILDCNAAANAAAAPCAGIAGNAATDTSSSYGYTADRLTSASGVFGQLSYGYDDAGNRVCRLADGTDCAGAPPSYTYDGQQLVGGPEGLTAHYDTNGNLDTKTSDGTVWGYEYDVDNRLARVTKKATGEPGDGAAAAEFVRDHRGRRLRTTHFAADGTTPTSTLSLAPEYEVVLAADGTPAQSTIYLVGPQGRRAALTRALQGVAVGAPGTPSPGTVYAFHKNQVASTRLVSDADGAVVRAVVATPYGRVVEIDNLAGDALPADDFRPKLDAKERLASLGLDDFGARFYDPELGRFTTADSRLGAGPFEQDAFNRYAFALNNPVRYTDPDGHQPTEPNWADVTAAIAEAVGAGAAAVAAVAGVIPGVYWVFKKLRQHFHNDALRQLEGLDPAELGDREILANPFLRGVHKRGMIQGINKPRQPPCASSFRSETQVATAAGPLPIEDLRVGTRVWAHHEATGEAGLYAVGNVHRRDAPGYLVLTVAGERISVTPEHPFRVSGRGWVEAAALRPGDRLRTLDGETVPVDAIEPRDETVRVFNLTVAEAETYYVSPLRVLVHNCPPDPESGEPLGEEPGELSGGDVAEMGPDDIVDSLADAGDVAGEIGPETAVAAGAEGGADAVAGGVGGTATAADAAATTAAEAAAVIAVDTATTETTADTLIEAVVFCVFFCWE